MIRNRTGTSRVKWTNQLSDHVPGVTRFLRRGAGALRIAGLKRGSRPNRGVMKSFVLSSLLLLLAVIRGDGSTGEGLKKPADAIMANLGRTRLLDRVNCCLCSPPSLAATPSHHYHSSLYLFLSPSLPPSLPPPLPLPLSPTLSATLAFQYVTCGSVLKLYNVESSDRLHSHDVKYGSGSGQQVGRCWLTRELVELRNVSIKLCWWSASFTCQ